MRTYLSEAANRLTNHQGLLNEATASPRMLALAKFLQAAAFNGAVPEIPAPLYLEQAKFMLEDAEALRILIDQLEAYYADTQ